MGPLGMSAKQHREYLKLQSQQQREAAKMERDESRKQQLHEIKLKEAAAKANQGIGHKEDIHATKLQELGSPLGKAPRMNKQKLGIPTQNPLADTGVLGQGQKKLYAQGTDTVPAMLTPGEAVIPEPAAQNPENKPIIKALVEEGRAKNKLRDGAVQVVPSLAYEHSDTPGSSFMGGSTDVPTFSRGSSAQANYADGTYGVVPQQVQSAAGYNDGTTSVNLLDRFLNTIAGQKIEVPPAESMPVMDPKLLEAQRGVESNNTQFYPPGHPKAYQLVTSPAGALGIAQIMPKTAASPGFGIQPLSSADLQNEGKQIEFQKQYMDKMFEKYKDQDKALTAYNAGPGNVDKAIDRANKAGKPDEWRSFLPTQEAKEYATKVNEKVTSMNAKPLPPGRQIPGGGFASNEGGAAFGNPNITREAATSIPRQQAISRGDYVPVPDVTQPTVPMLEKFPKGIPVTPDQVAEANPVLPVDVTNTVPEVDKPQAPSLLETKPEEANKTIAQISQEKANIIQGFLNDPGYNQLGSPEEKKSWLEKAIGSVYGPTGVFSSAELARFAILAAGGIATGRSVGGSLRFAGLDALKSADERRALQAKNVNESAKNTRELLERLDSDYRTALGENVPPEVRSRAVELYQGARSPEQKRAVIQLLKMNKSTEDTMGTGKPGVVSKGFFDGKPMEFRNQAGNVQRVNSKGEWENIPPSELKRFQTKTEFNDNRDRMIKSNVARLTPVLREAFGGDKKYNAEDNAKRYAEVFDLILEDLGPNVSPTSFAKMSENTIKSAVESAKATGTNLTEEGLRKAFFGNAVIETKMVTGNKEMYMAKDSKGKFTLPSAPYQAALGTAMEVYKKQGIDLGEASNAIENKFNKLPAETRKKFTQMSAGAPGSTPMLLWLQQTGGTN
jgi:hypothetical protein